VVVVRGRVDQKGRDQMSVVVQDASVFEPGADELAQARDRARKRMAPEQIILRIDASRFGADLVEELKGLFEAYPGRTEVMVEMATREGIRKLRFGDSYRVDPDHGLRAELDQLLGPKALAA
jgi:DNA polymerase-3 subunit alpha